MKKVLITGVGGYIGSVAAYLLLQKGVQVVGVDNLSKGHIEAVRKLQQTFGSGLFHFYKIDLRDDITSIFIKEQNIDAVLHYAAFCDVNESMNDPKKYFDNNIQATNNLVSTMLTFGIKRIVFSSTCAVYGNVTKVPVSEKAAINPLSPYGLSKYLAEKVIESYRETVGLEYVIFRYFNVTGATDDGMIGDSKKPSTLLVQNVVRGALKIAPFYATFAKAKTKDGSPVRDFIHVVDLNEAHIQGIEYLENGGESTIINLGTGKGTSVLEVVKTAEKVIGVAIPIEAGVGRKGDIEVMYAVPTKAHRLLGWKAKRTLEDAISSLVLWYSHNPHGWKSKRIVSLNMRKITLSPLTKRAVRYLPSYFSR